MFKRIFIEKQVLDSQLAINIKKRFENKIEIIDNYEDFWGKKRKPYLDKRTNLDLYIAKKKGQLVKEAPNAYGLKEDLHYYFIHTYNCIYECEYCFLQGYFKTPDIVLFANHDEIIQKMKEILEQNPNKTAWFHAGEFSDSLALSHFTQEFEYYFNFLEQNPNAKIEYRTKSVNIHQIKKLKPLKNAYISFSLSPEGQAQSFDLKCPITQTRIKAIHELLSLGFEIGIHFDPIIYHENIIEEYQALLQNLFDHPQAKRISYFSLGVVRFTKDVYQEVLNNYPHSKLLSEKLSKSFDQKVRYPRPLRLWLLNTIKSEIQKYEIEESKIYLCMENE